MILQTFDPAAATAAYLAQMPPEVHTKATAYTQGGHWLLLWSFLVTAVATIIIVRSGVLRRIQQRLEATRARPVLVALAVTGVYMLFAWVISLPWEIYERWWRQKQYGLTSQPFGGWLGESLMSTIIGAIFAGLFFAALYALMRRSPRRWWLWSGVLAMVFLLFGLLLAPLYIEPLFNKYTPAPNGPVRDAVVAMARANGVPSDKIFIYNGSKQSNAYTANVSGIAGTARVAMSDVMFLKDADLAEVRGVVGHEMGHYVRQHALWGALALGVLAMLAFVLVAQFFPTAARMLGTRDLTGIADPVGLPVLLLLVSLLGLIGTPLTNTLARTIESDADRFSLEHVNEPDGLAKALIKTMEYRAATPSGLEEIIFYDHPSVSLRVRRAMEWKAAHLGSTGD
ncbi:MAG: M48 family metalloprotease [Gemmatimonadaceae bacterium]